MNKYKYILAALLIIGIITIGSLAVIFSEQLKAATSGVTLTATIATYLSTSVDSATKAFGTITPASPASAESTQTTTTNNAAGYNIKINRDDADTAMDLTTDAAVNITDQTAWLPGADKDTAGNATTTANFINSGNVLAFRAKETGSNACGFSSTWWGTDGGTKLYAGFNNTAKTTFDCDSYQSGSTAAIHEYYLNVIGSQKTGDYNGAITYTVTANP